MDEKGYISLISYHTKVKILFLAIDKCWTSSNTNYTIFSTNKHKQKQNKKN